MSYSEKQLEEISRDPVRLKGYFWHVAMNAKRIAIKNREQLRQQGETFPPTGFKEVFRDGHDLHHWAQTMDSFSEAILNNLDAFVESSLEEK